MQILRPSPRPTESDILQPEDLCFTREPSGGWWYSVQLESHCSRHLISTAQTLTTLLLQGVLSKVLISSFGSLCLTSKWVLKSTFRSSAEQSAPETGWHCLSCSSSSMSSPSLSSCRSSDQSQGKQNGRNCSGPSWFCKKQLSSHRTSAFRVATLKFQAAEKPGVVPAVLPGPRSGSPGEKGPRWSPRAGFKTECFKVTSFSELLYTNPGLRKLFPYAKHPNYRAN